MIYNFSFLNKRHYFISKIKYHSKIHLRSIYSNKFEEVSLLVHISICTRLSPIKSQYDWICEMELGSSSRVWVSCRWCIWRPKISNYCIDVIKSMQ